MKMTEEYFYVEEVNDESKFYQQDYAINNKSNKSTDSIPNRPHQDVRLHEMEEQLEIAENRCNTLKGQLDHMKKLYQSNRTDIKVSKQVNKKTVYSVCNPSPKRNPVDFLSYSKNTEARSTTSINVSDKSIVLERQNSKAITTDTSGAAVQTINNILNGITDSVNRLSQIHVHIENDRKERPSSKRLSKTRDSACGDDTPIVSMEIQTSPRYPDEMEMKREENSIDRSQSFVKNENICRRSSTVLSIKSKTTTTTKKKTRRKTPYNNKSTLQNSTITVNITNKRSLRSTAKHVEKRFKIEPVKMINKDSSSILSPKKSKRLIRRSRFKALSQVEKGKTPTKHMLTESDKLVELYHNNAAKGSDTDDSNTEVRKSKVKEVKPRKSSTETVPSLPLDDPSETSMFKRQEQNQRQPQNQQLQYQQQHHQPYESLYSSYNNNKQLSPIEENVYMEPTAPRTECFSMCSKNYELPTIASKMKQVAKSYLRRFNFHSIPFCAAKSTSPSHNIGINIQQVMSIIKTRQPVTGISPTLAHNIGLAAEKLQGNPFTAMVSSLGSRIAYGKSQCPLTRPNVNYQHLQEMAKEIPEDEYEDGNIKRMSEGAMACGDRSSTPRWTVDQASQKNCTCIPQQGVGFQQVLSRYHSNSFSASTVSQFHYRPKTRHSRQIQTATGKLRNKLSLTRPTTKLVENKTSMPLRNKEKNLKEVLSNLHDEFSNINQEYDLLSKRVEELGPNADDETVKQLEQMERCLSNKEEEITMVMSLYKEVLALKQQVKCLKEKASMASLSINMQQPYCMQQARHDPNSAVHLTKFLRQIQMYQEMNRIGRRS